jgi:O-acetyl-ADP-ribose deacetylase (regulator of RNase III)
MKTIDCNLLDVQADIIGHCCNCQNTMGSGVAAAIRQEYPEAYDVDCKTVKADKAKLGTVSLAVVIDPTLHKNQTIKAVVNLYGQYSYGGERPMSYEAIYTALVAFKEKLKPAVKTVAFPYKMGADRAGGSWPIIEKMIEIVFENSGVDVIICKFDPNKSPV